MKNIIRHYIKSLLFLIVGFLIFPAIVCAQNNFEVLRIIKGGAANVEEKNRVHFIVIKDQLEFYSIVKQWDYDIPLPELKVFNNGASVMINSFNGVLTFFDQNGQEVLRKKIGKEMPVKYERTIQSTVDENTLLISLSHEQMGFSEILFYGIDGNLINKWNVQTSFVNGLVYSKKQGRTAVSGYSWQNDNLDKSTYFFNEDGVLISTAELNFNSGNFDSETLLFSGFTNNNYFLYDFENQKVIFDFAAGENKMIIAAGSFQNEIIVVETAKPFLEDGTWYYSDPQFTRFTTSGNKIKSWQEKQRRFSTFELKDKQLNLQFKMDNSIISLN